MSMCFIPFYTPLLYSKNRVYRGIHAFLIFALKHILWVLVRGGSNEAVLTCTHNIYFGQKYESSQKFQLKMVIFTAVKNRCILHGRVFVRHSFIPSLIVTRIPLDGDLLMFSLSTTAFGENYVFGSVWEISLAVFSSRNKQKFNNSTFYSIS